ncbi:MAG: hypothetical protein PUB69_00185 [Desulfovibrionaceae bacterium]|nr:hypothetical protein [Desulfovibrionaceae bacterium]
MLLLHSNEKQRENQEDEAEDSFKLLFAGASSALCRIGIEQGLTGLVDKGNAKK